jgi:hypothetical protein
MAYGLVQDFLTMVRKRQKEFCTGRDGACAIKSGPNDSISNSEPLA